MSESSTAKILSYQFSDPDELEAIVREQQDFHLIPLDRKPMRTNILQLQLEQGAIEFRYLNNPLRVWGDKRSDYLVFELILSPILGNYLSHGFALQPHTLYGFDRTRGIDLVLPGQLLTGTLFIKKEVVDEYLKIMGREDINAHFFAQNYVQIPTTFLSLQDYLRELYYLVQRRDKFLSQSQISRLILEDYLPLLIDAIPLTPAPSQQPQTFLPRSRLVREAETYMLNHLEKPITLKDMCKILKTSKSPLNYAFKEVFGLPPLTYLKILRLHAAHHLLKTAEPTCTAIAQIAHRFGFWHTGRFSHYYRELFGELPSETLSKC